MPTTGKQGPEIEGVYGLRQIHCLKTQSTDKMRSGLLNSYRFVKKNIKSVMNPS